MSESMTDVVAESDSLKAAYEARHKPDALALVEEARREWETLSLIGYHGTPSGVFCADLTMEDVEQIRDLIRRLGHALQHGGST